MDSGLYGGFRLDQSPRVYVRVGLPTPAIMLEADSKIVAGVLVERPAYVCARGPFGLAFLPASSFRRNVLKPINIV